jgi:hypothetical protein
MHQRIKLQLPAGWERLQPVSDNTSLSYSVFSNLAIAEKASPDDKAFWFWRADSPLKRFSAAKSVQCSRAEYQ